jgi:hypothetical protein
MVCYRRGLLLHATYLGLAATAYFACNEDLLSFRSNSLDQLLVWRRRAVGGHDCEDVCVRHTADYEKFANIVAEDFSV